MNNTKTFFEQKITTMNFVLALLVMFIHSENTSLYGSTLSLASCIEKFISITLGDLAVPLFYMISSYLFYRNYDSSQISKKYQRRIKSILIPYFVWNVLYLILFCVITRSSYLLTLMTTEIFSLSWKLLFDSIPFHKFNMVFWFMQQLIYFIILSPLVYGLTKKKIFPFLSIALIFLGAYIPSFPNNTYGIRIDMLTYWILGCYFATHKTILFEKKNSSPFSLVCFTVLIITRYVSSYYMNDITFYNIVMSILLFINVPLFWFSINWVPSSYLPWWTRITFFIYASHPLLVDGLKKVNAAFLPHTSLWMLINYFLLYL